MPSNKGTRRVETGPARCAPGLLVSCCWSQTLGGGSGGTELKSVGELLAEIGDIACEGTARTSWSVRDGMARGAGAHTVARAQLAGDIGSPAERLRDGILPCSGILHSC